MARYKTVGQAFINDAIVPANTEVEYDGEPGDNLIPVDEAAHAAVEAARTRRAEKAAALASGVGGLVNEETQKLLASLSDGLTSVRSDLTALASRVAAIEAAPPGASVDTSAFAQQHDVNELDAGLQIFSGRLDEVEGVLAALSKKVEAAPAPADPPAPESVTAAPVTE